MSFSDWQDAVLQSSTPYLADPNSHILVLHNRKRAAHNRRYIHLNVRHEGCA